MAAVQILAAFAYRWAQDGTVVPIDEAQYRAGWAFIGDTPPTVEQFNRVHQIADEKTSYLYQQMQAIFNLAGQTPEASNAYSLRDSLESVYGDGKLMRILGFTTSQTYTITNSRVRRIRVTAQAAGGAGGGSAATDAGTISVGTGGGGGATATGFFATTPGYTASLVVGAPGVGVSGGNGTAGGNTSFGALLLAQGGLGGLLYGPTSPPFTGGWPNTAAATGGYLQVAGSDGGAGIMIGTTGISGAGGNSLHGVGGGVANVGAGGAAKNFGAGGGGSVSNQSSAAFAGGTGSGGLILIEEFE